MGIEILRCAQDANRFLRERGAGEEDFAAGREDDALQGLAVRGQKGDGGAGVAGERRLQGGEEGGTFGGAGGLKQDVNLAAATEAEGYLGCVIKERGVAVHGGAAAGHPESFARDLGFEAATADGSGVAAILKKEDVGAGATVRGARGAGERDQNGRLLRPLLPKVHEIAAFHHKKGINIALLR